MTFLLLTSSKQMLAEMWLHYWEEFFKFKSFSTISNVLRDVDHKHVAWNEDGGTLLWGTLTIFCNI